MVGILNALVNLLMAAGIGVGVAIWIGRGGRRSSGRRIVAVATGIALAAVSLWGVIEVEKLENTARGVVVSIVASALIFITANKLFDLAPDRWAVFTTLVGAGGTFTVYALMWGNRAIDDPVLRTVIATLVGAVAGYLLGTVREKWSRLAIGIVTGGGLGALAASGMRRVILVFELEQGTFELWPILPDLDYGILTGSTLVGAVLGLLLWQVRGRRTPLVRPLVLGATVGFFVGGWVLPGLGTGTKTDALVAAIGVGVGVGALVGLKTIPGAQHRDASKTPPAPTSS